MTHRFTAVAACLLSAFAGAITAQADDILDLSVPVARVVSDCKFTEGPAFDAKGILYFSDGANDRIMRLTPDGQESVFRQPAGRANGLKWDAAGRLVMCQSASSGGKRRVARVEFDGAETSLAETYSGERLNAPNDLTIDRQGRIYFTDIRPADAPAGQGLASGVYRIDAPGKFTRVIDNLERPNGIVLTPDGRTLYVSDRGTQKLHRYEVQPDGGLKLAGIVYDFAPDRGVDGMCLDVEGNIYAAAGEKKTTGLWIVSPAGKLLLHQPMPEFSTNVAFGGADMRDLYLTASTSVYKLRTMKAGAKLIGAMPPAPAAAAALGDDPRRPPAIATEDVPVVPADIAEKLRQYQNIRSAEFRGWSPENGMLVRTRFGNAAQLHQVYEPGGRRDQMTFFDEPVTGMFLPRARDEALLLVMSQGGSENDQVYLLDHASYRTSLITDGKSRHLLGPVRNDGARMIVLGNQRNGRDTDIYIADCRKPNSLELVLSTPGKFWHVTDWSRDGRQLLLYQYVSINECYPAVFDLETRKLEMLPLLAAGKAAVGTMRFAPDGQSALITTDAAGEFLELYRFDLKSKKYAPLTRAIPHDVATVEVEREGEQVAFTTSDNGTNQLYLLRGDKPQPVELPRGTITGLDFSPDHKQLGFTLGRLDAPADAYSIELKPDGQPGELARWTFSEVGGLNPQSFVAPEAITFSAFDGRQIPAWYFRPRSASAKRPAGVVISIHGGPESQYRPEFSGLFQFYVSELGLAVIAPNVRGSAGYGKTYLQLDNGPNREDSVRDIGALLDWIGQQKELDAKRMGVTGASYGGFMVLASLVQYGDRLRAGIDSVGIANFITFLERTSPYRQDLRRVEYGDERDPEMRKVFERISPVAGADKIRSALLVAHGRNDPRVPFSETEQIAAKVRAAGRTVWSVYADNEGHGFQKKDNRDYFNAVEALFLKQQLGGDESSEKR